MSTVSGALLVPIHLDALHLTEERTVTAPAADFTGLPYFDGQRDVNGDRPYLGDAVNAQPLHDQGLILRPGVHLHWSLPDALTGGAHDDEGTTFPVVPTRWLVTRSRADTTGTVSVERRWVVESDYLRPSGEADEGSVLYPLPPEDGRRPYRGLGRTVPFEQWTGSGTGAAYLPGLTVVGWGHPTFAALYPNCHSVFGFHDPQPGDTGPGLQYDVAGWYRDPAADPATGITDLAGLGWTIRALVSREEILKLRGASPALWTELLDRRWLTADGSTGALVMSPAWRAGQPLGDAFREFEEPVNALLDAAPGTGTPPARTVCFARLRFEAGDGTPGEPTGPAVTVADSGPEALIAYLSDGDDEAARRLDALLGAAAVGHDGPDTEALLADARHERTFQPVPGPVRWTVSSERDEGEPAPLPTTMPGLLARLNDAEEARYLAETEIAERSRRLFADWCRFQMCAYPPLDEAADYPDLDLVRTFLENRALAPLEERRTALARLTAARNLAEARARAAVRHLPGLSLSSVAGPRFYQPAEPVVLLTGDGVTPSPRYGRDGRLRPDGMLETRVAAAADPADPEALWQILDEVWRELADSPRTDEIGFALLRRPPWHPVLLEWQVAFLPRTGATDRYPQDYLATAYELGPDGDDLIPRSTGQPVEPGATEHYSGAAILTPFVAPQLRELIARYLVDLVQRRDLDTFGATGSDSSDIDAVVAFYLDRADDPVHTIARAYQRLGTGFAGLSQALGGFNEALLARRQATQLPIADPLGHPADRALAHRVADAIGDGGTSAPVPANDFNPIRAGALRLARLRLVDSFGQARDLSWDRIVLPETLREPGNPGWIAMPPRLTQPARLHLRWLAAAQDGLTEAGADAAGTPICGWIVPNHLDGSLAFHDGDGVALGEVDPFAKWQPAPGAAAPILPTQVHDPGFGGMPPALRRIAARLTVTPGASDTGQAAYLSAFTEALESALDTVDPAGADQQRDGLSLLVSRPVAVVRAAVDLQLREPPAVDQSWTSFDQDLRRTTRETRDFTGVRFPVRIGAGGRAGDGLLGFWAESGGDTFRAVAPGGTAPERIIAADGPAALVQQSIDDPPEILTMLVDPRGIVHASCGVLPTKAIGLPSEQYTAGLTAIQTSFLTAPLLTSRDRLHVSLPGEPGWTWSWLAPEPGPDGPAWRETPAEETITRDVFLQHLPDAAALWAHLLDPAVRWLADQEPGVVALSVARRRRPQLSGEFAGLEALADELLGIDPASGTAPAAPITAEQFASAMPEGADVWDHLCAAGTGWLEPLDGDPGRCRVVPPDQRPGAAPDADRPDRMVPAELAGPYRVLTGRVALIFDLYATGIAAMRTDAHHPGAQEIREGWLTLRPAREARTL
ncbi:hypothetical protein [Actinoplanes couchii]|uniref:hypothetical protein n=1 Tax=Actinoplanes couchii TaxID=403638 RepID=UPI00194054B6|nr:hypothetical protein [Actinoplanes couchii]MDR6320211.1 hypothetical protein [Actinoplanes couchii]